MPGRLRKNHLINDNKFSKRKALIVTGYNILLGIIILFGYLLTKYMVRGGL